MLDRIKAGLHLILSLPPSRAVRVPPLALSRCPKFAGLERTANFDRFAALASLFPPPAALRRRRPSGGGKVGADFRLHRSWGACPCRTELGRARRPAPTVVRIYFHHSRNACPCRTGYGGRENPPGSGPFSRCAPSRAQKAFLNSKTRPGAHPAGLSFCCVRAFTRPR